MRQIDLAEASGVSGSLISMIERGYVPAGPSRVKIAEILGQEQAALWPDHPVYQRPTK